MPRAYTLGKRAVQQADTRRRIIDAAIALYLERGVSSTTMQDVARRADVAPGTVANHFGSREALANEVSITLLSDLRMPTPDMFDGVEGLGDRIHLMLSEMAAFFERVEPWWRASQRESGVSFWADAERRYYGELDTLIRVALGPLGDDDAVALITTVLGRWVLGSLVETGRTTEQAVDLLSEVFTDWLEGRAASDRRVP